MAALGFDSLGKMAKGTGINKKVLIFGGLGLGLLILFMSMRRPAAASEEVPAGGVIEGAYEGPDNMLQDQMRYDNLQSILLGQVDQELNMAFQDQREKDREQDEKSAAYEKSLTDLTKKMEGLQPVTPPPTSKPAPAPAPAPKPAAPKPVAPKPMIPKPKPIAKPVTKPAPKPAPKPAVKKPAPKPAPAIPKKTYATPKKGWDANSVVDTFKKQGLQADFATRKKVATSKGIKNYTGTAAQNIQLNKLMKPK